MSLLLCPNYRKLTQGQVYSSEMDPDFYLATGCQIGSIPQYNFLNIVFSNC